MFLWYNNPMSDMSIPADDNPYLKAKAKPAASQQNPGHRPMVGKHSTLGMKAALEALHADDLEGLEVQKVQIPAVMPTATPVKKAEPVEGAEISEAASKKEIEELKQRIANLEARTAAANKKGAAKPKREPKLQPKEALGILYQSGGMFGTGGNANDFMQKPPIKAWSE